MTDQSFVLVFNQVTSHNEENQKYLLSYQNGVLVDCVMRLCLLAANELPSYDAAALSSKDSVAETLLVTLLSAMKVLMVLASDIFNAKGDGRSFLSPSLASIEEQFPVLNLCIQFVACTSFSDHPAEILGKKDGIFAFCLRCFFTLSRVVPDVLKAELMILVSHVGNHSIKNLLARYPSNTLTLSPLKSY